MSTKKNVFTLSKILDKIKSLTLDLDSTKQELQDLNSNIQKYGTEIMLVEGITIANSGVKIVESISKFRKIAIEYVNQQNNQELIVNRIEVSLDYFVSTNTYKCPAPAMTGNGYAYYVSDTEICVGVSNTNQGYYSCRVIGIL